MRKPNAVVVRFLLGASLLAGCAGDQVTAPVAHGTPGIGITLTGVTYRPIFPGDTVLMGVTVDVQPTQTATSARVIFKGVFNDTLDLPVPQAGTFHYNVSMWLNRGPIRGRLTVTAIAQLGTQSASDTDSLEVVDDGDPQLDIHFTAIPQLGDTMRVQVAAHDVATVPDITYNVHGAINSSLTILNHSPDDFATELKFFVPPASGVGDSVIITVTVKDGFGNQTTRTLRNVVQDLKAPTITATLSSGRYDALLPSPGTTYFTGDTITISAQARDNHRLGWLGWRIEQLGLGDSLPVSDTLAAHTWSVPVTAAMESPGQVITTFVRDSVGYGGAAGFQRNFVDGVLRATEVIPGPTDPVDDLVYSRTTGRVLILSNGTVTSLTVTPLGRRGSVATPVGGFGIDMLPTSDTAWAGARFGNTLAGRRFYAVPATATPLTVPRTVDIPFLTARPIRVRALPGNRLLVTAPAASDNVLFVDLATEQTVPRTAAGFLASLAVSGDHSLVVSYDGNENAMAYDATTDVFGALKLLIPGTPSVDEHGTMVLIHNRLYDRSLNYLRSVTTTDYDAFESRISDDGQYAWFARWPGLHKIRISDGALVEKIYLPYGSSLPRLVLADQDKLFTIGSGLYTAVDLSPTGILTSASRSLLH